MDVNGKVWGSTSKLFAKSNVEIFRIEGIKGGCSSMHTHTSKWSMFFVEKGRLKIVVEKNDYDLTDTTILDAQQSMIIAPGEYHRFEVLKEGTVAYEFYWVELQSNDIVRRDQGFVNDS